MHLKYPIRLERLFLRNLEIHDNRSQWKRWLEDSEVNRYLETRFMSYQDNSLREYLQEMNLSKNNLLLGIFLNSKEEHIGNIKLGSINYQHSHADIGILIGKKEMWGQGFASEAIHAMSEYAFKDLALRKLLAGCYDQNIGSIRAFKKVGFVQEGLMRDHWVGANSQVMDGVLLGCTASDFESYQ